MSYVSLNELAYLQSVIEALRDEGWFDFSYVGLSNNMKGKRIIALRPVECDDRDDSGKALWEGRFEFVIGLAQPIGKTDAYIGTQSEPGLVYLTEVVQETLAKNLDALCYNYEIGAVRYEQFSQHPQFVARFFLDITKGINTHDRARDASAGVTVPALQAQNLGDLGDVSTSGVTNGQVIAYNSTSGLWEAGDAVGGVSDHGSLTGLSDDDHTQYALADGTRTFDFGELEDVDVAGAADGALVHYDSGSGDWIDATGVTISSGEAPLNIPLLTSSPTSPANGDLWIEDAGTVYLYYKRSDNGQLLRIAFSAVP